MHSSALLASTEPAPYLYILFAFSVKTSKSVVKHISKKESDKDNISLKLGAIRDLVSNRCSVMMMPKDFL